MPGFFCPGWDAVKLLIDQDWTICRHVTIFHPSNLSSLVRGFMAGLGLCVAVVAQLILALLLWFSAPLRDRFLSVLPSILLQSITGGWGHLYEYRHRLPGFYC